MTIIISTHIHFNTLEMIRILISPHGLLSARNDHHLDPHSMPTSYVSTFDHMHLLPPTPAISKLTLATKSHFKCITLFVHLLCLHAINLPFFFIPYLELFTAMKVMLLYMSAIIAIEFAYNLFCSLPNTISVHIS